MLDGWMDILVNALMDGFMMSGLVDRLFSGWVCELVGKLVDRLFIGEWIGRYIRYFEVDLR